MRQPEYEQNSQPAANVREQPPPVHELPGGVWRPARMFGGATVVIIAGGPSLTEAQVARVHAARGRNWQVRAIAINNGYQIAPWADVLYGADHRWWNWHNMVPGFVGLKVAMKWNAESGAWWPGWEGNAHPEILGVAGTGYSGMDFSGNGLRRGGNSGHQAVNLAVLMGARKILLLGFDYRTTGGQHWHGQHPIATAADTGPWLRAARVAAPQLAAAGVEVINCTPGSALDAFPQISLDEALDGIGKPQTD